MLPETKQNLKKKLEDNITENLNNKAPYKTIIHSIKSSNKKGKSLYNYINYTVRARRKGSRRFWNGDFMCATHPRNVFSEAFDGGLPSGFFETPHKSLHPWMISTVHNFDRSDPVLDLLEKTQMWIRTWNCFSKTISNVLKSRPKSQVYKWLSDDVMYCPKSFTDMAAHLVNKPDPYFYDVYNWYYSGKGNLSIAQFEGLDYIIYSDFNCLRVSLFFKDNYSIDYTSTACYKCNEDTNILETVHSQNIIAIRAKCKVMILKLSTESMTLHLVTEMESELPYTSISFDEFHKNILYVTTLDYQLTIVNIDRLTRRSVKLRGKFTSLEDNWNSVMGSERGCYLHVTRKALTLYDKRTNAPYQRYKSIAAVSDILECAQISVAKYCTGKPLLYVGTTHELFLVDMRCGKTKADNMTPAQKWTHGMFSTPVYIDVCGFGDYNKEAVCVSSQWFEDMCVVTNYEDRISRAGDIPGLSLPYRPPSIRSTLMRARQRRLCCSLESPLRQRLLTLISGAALVPQHDTYSVLMQNSLGDITCHPFHPHERIPYLEDDAPERLHEWSQHLEPKEQPVFKVTKVVDVSPLLRNLRRIPEDFVLGRNSVISQRCKFNEEQIYETYEQERLDPEFLEVWKDHEEDITLKDDGSRFFVDT